MPPEATLWGAEISWGPFLVPYGGTYHELFLPGGVFGVRTGFDPPRGGQNGFSSQRVPPAPLLAPNNFLNTVAKKLLDFVNSCSNSGRSGSSPY